jgi:hypothetical protein
VEELLDGLWRWTRLHPAWRHEEVASFLLRDARGTVLVDPLVDGADDPLLADLDALVTGALRILITIPYHVRSSELLRDRYANEHRAAIWGPAGVAKRLAQPRSFHPVTGGDTLPEGLRFHPIGRPRRAEMPLELPRHRALVFGDAVLEVDGELRVWERALDSERRRRWYEERLLPTLRPLAELDIAHVLVTHGEPVLHRGREALAAALDRPPWHETG